MQPVGKLSLLLALAIVSCLSRPAHCEAGIQIEAVPVSGQLDVLQGTAIKLGGKVEQGQTPARSYAWEILEGRGGKLYDADKPTAIFVAPALDVDLEVFVVRCTVQFDGQPPSTAVLTVRVHRTAPSEVPGPGSVDAGSEPSDPKADEPESETAWLDEMYRGKAEDDRRKQRQPQVVPIPTYRHYPSWGFGPGWGWGFGWGGFIDYPIFVPMVMSGPGVTVGPGHPGWSEPVPVPYDRLITTFPEAIAGNYLPQDYPLANADLPRVDMPVQAYDLPDLPTDAYDDPMIDPGFGVDDIGW